MQPARRLFWTMAAAAVAADQLTKWAVYGKILLPRDMTIVPGFFLLARAENRGVVWGLFGKWPQAVLIVGLAAAGLVALYFYRYAGRSKVEAAALGMILGGAVSNLLDRAVLGYVRDFLDFYILGYHWPTFNVADSFISVGAGIVIWLLLSGSEREV